MAKYRVTLEWEQIFDEIDADNEDQAENIALENAMCDEPPCQITVKKVKEPKFYPCEAMLKADILATSQSEAEMKLYDILTSCNKNIREVQTKKAGGYYF